MGDDAAFEDALEVVAGNAYLLHLLRSELYGGLPNPLPDRDEWEEAFSWGALHAGVRTLDAVLRLHADVLDDLRHAVDELAALLPPAPGPEGARDPPP